MLSIKNTSFQTFTRYFEFRLLGSTSFTFTQNFSRSLIKAERKKEEAIKRAEREAQEKREAEAKAVAELVEIGTAENMLLNGGTIKDTNLIVKIADKLGITIPIRTKGWILNSLAECTISDSGSMSYRYWKTKGGKGSQKVYEILFDIRNALKDLKTE